MAKQKKKRIVGAVFRGKKRRDHLFRYLEEFPVEIYKTTWMYEKGGKAIHVKRRNFDLTLVNNSD
jgi:hypothetical protein